ncbi:VirK/YbjX family protein [Photobacterium profundum]|uniref:VirK/YbjX family protein n=2 Tax=Photobacterium profundum TaxID=74109 RepID=UPI002159045E|nr:VirK/YbjX family protein [Photobacterium profundum]
MSSYLRALPKIADDLYPGSTGWRRIKKNVRFCLWGITNANAVKSMMTLFDNETLSPVLKSDPRILEKPLKPYLCVNWSRAERVTHIQDHFNFCQHIFGSNLSKIYENVGLTILSFDDSKGDSYQVKLCAGGSREGSLGLQLKDAQNRTIYSLSCHVSTRPKTIFYIGSVQGPSDDIEDRNDVIKLLTRSVHGLRTKALMLEVALMLAKILGVDEVHGISNKAHIYQALRYVGSKRKSVTFDYNDLWEEYGAEVLNKYFYKIPLHPLRKDPTTLKKTKRRLYVKRYQWLEDSEQAVMKSLCALSTNLDFIAHLTSMIKIEEPHIEDAQGNTAKVTTSINVSVTPNMVKKDIIKMSTKVA